MDERWQSRKFIITVLGLALLATARWTHLDAIHVVAIVGLYVGAEGGADIATRLKGSE